MEYGFREEELKRYINEQIYSLPGVEQPQEKFSIILTGSRATGTYNTESDVDIDVICSDEVYQSVRNALISDGRMRPGDECYFLLPAAMSLLNSVNELYRFFFIVEGRPYPYTEKLPRFVETTALGREFAPFLREITDMAIGRTDTNEDVWDRLDRAKRMLCHSNESEKCRRLEKACAEAMLKAGVEPDWVAADYDNIDQLLTGRLGSVEGL